MPLTPKYLTAYFLRKRAFSYNSSALIQIRKLTLI